MSVNFTDAEAAAWPVRPDTPATRVDEIITTTKLEILNVIYKQRGVSRTARSELSGKISEAIEAARMRIARELGEGSA